MPERPSVSVVLLVHNRPYPFSEALESIRKQTYPLHEILVVDNRSPRSGEIAEIVARAPEVRLIANEKNLGFTGGMNTGLRAATGDYVLITEDDIVADPGCVEALVEYAMENPTTTLSAGLMLNQGTKLIQCAGGEQSIGRRFSLTIHGAGLADEGQFAKPFPVTFLAGAFLFARRSDWQRWGGFREDFFIYYDDNDLCLRVLREGGTLTVVPRARLNHVDPPPGKPPSWLGRMKLRNFLSFLLLHAPARYLPELAVRYAFWPFLKSACTFRGDAWQQFLAMAMTFGRLPGLLRDRWRMPNRVEGKPR